MSFGSLKYRVRRGHAGDRRAVLELFLAALQEHGFAAIDENVNPEVASFGATGDPARDDFVVVSGRKVCGFAILIGQSDGWGELSKVFVAPTHRGCGVGTMLIETCILTARERGVRELFLETHTAFAYARRYYERHGWTLWPTDDTTTRMYTMKVVGTARVELPKVSGVRGVASGRKAVG